MKAGGVRRALGALYGVAIGDALGMPTQDLTPQVIKESYGPIDDFFDASPVQLIAAGQRAGTITDDTEQMVIVAEMLGSGGHFDQVEFANRLDLWEQDMRRRDSLDLLGPSTKAAIEAIRNGVSAQEAGKNGTTNGAAMRAAPIGVAAKLGPELMQLIKDVCMVTHNTAPAMAAAGAVAAAVSAGIDGYSTEDALEIAKVYARELEADTPSVPGPSFSARWNEAEKILRSSSDPLVTAYEVIGTRVDATESVITALGFCSLEMTPWEAVCASAGVGGDTDTIACIVGAILGATRGVDVYPEYALDLVKKVNQLDFTSLVDKLLLRREQKGSDSE